jgi:hypothetical protein
MKAKSFQEYLEKKLNKAELAEIEEFAKLETEFFQSLLKIMVLKMTIAYDK